MIRYTELHPAAIALMLIFGVLFVGTLQAEPVKPPPKPPVLGWQQQSQSQGQEQQAESNATSTSTSTNENTNTNTATGGSAESHAEGGDAHAEGGHGGAGGNVEINSSYRQVRQAPSVGLVSSNTTAGCIVALGAGGSNTNGSGLLTIGLTQRDCLRWVYFEELADSGEPRDAARVVCAGWTNKLRRWMGGRENCHDAMRRAALSRQQHHQPVVIHHNSDCDERLGRCEARLKGSAK